MSNEETSGIDPHMYIHGERVTSSADGDILSIHHRTKSQRNLQMVLPSGCEGSETSGLTAGWREIHKHTVLFVDLVLRFMTFFLFLSDLKC